MIGVPCAARLSPLSALDDQMTSVRPKIINTRRSTNRVSQVTSGSASRLPIPRGISTIPAPRAS